MSNRCLHATTEINYNILVEEMTAFYLKFKGIRSLFCWGGEGGVFLFCFWGFFFLLGRGFFICIALLSYFYATLNIILKFMIKHLF